MVITCTNILSPVIVHRILRVEHRLLATEDRFVWQLSIVQAHILALYFMKFYTIHYYKSRSISSLV